ncbi:ketopantoate reductase family protein [Georgenia ruanii]|uniref:2-dehydropantoate 2-reductase n=1 Tax=Georgenia ruanii TaxID=348442 RepID=A0A7J9USN1_9MICO|nr:2-dehydropantoate 2-reductase [Georgenia ruanii]MPV87532.1 2-dehydropantoate 2-reductase [Georgenia ruanii]
MITVVGPGAVGGLLAALLHRAGEDVVAVARPATAQRIAAEGLQVRSDAFGTWTAHVPATTAVPAGSAVVLAVKAYALDDVLPGIVAARPRAVLALLNGTAHARALHAAGLEDVACASIQVEAAREQEAIVHRGGYCIVTVPDAAAGGAVPEALARAGVTVRTGGSENEVLWRKYSFLAPTALLTSWTDLPIGPALERDPAVTAGVVEEVAAVATAEGLTLEPERLMAALRKLPGTLESSLQHDVRRGGASELEALGGNLLALAAEHAIPAPSLERVVGDLRGRHD